jgi:hypothetical protein
MNNIFSNMATSSKNTIYLSLTASLFACSLLLNLSNKLVACSLCFVFIAFCANLIAELYGKKRAIATIALCSLATFIVSWKTLDLMLLVSFFSVLLSCYGAISISSKLTSMPFQMRNLLSLSIASTIDSLIMSTSLLNKFSVHKSILIGFKDLMFKFSYLSVTSLCLCAALYLASSLRSRDSY